MKYIINGGVELNGEVTISGNKNEVLPCMAAALLTDNEVYLDNIPDIRDVEVFTKMLEGLGVEVKKQGHSLMINSSKINKHKLPKDLTHRIRASILLVGPLLARFGRAEFDFPGGDVIGRRSIDVHLDGFKALGADIERDGVFKIGYKPSEKNITISLPQASVTATENLLLFSVLGKRVVSLKNVAVEPHVVNLCKLLIQMGAKIDGVGTNSLRIEGVDTLNGAKFRVSDDIIEIGTYAIAAAISKGKVIIKCSPENNLEPITKVLESFGLVFKRSEQGLLAMANELHSPGTVVTNIWPGFPTDLMSPVIVLATQAKGKTLCHDWMYESRMFFVDKLITMGADITIADPHRVFINGPRMLYGRVLETPDIRAGMALVLAAIIAEGESVINHAELIERGYEDVPGKLKALGVKIEQR